MPDKFSMRTAGQQLRFALQALQQTLSDMPRSMSLLLLAFFVNFLGYSGAQNFLVAVLKDNGDENIGLNSLAVIYASFFACSILGAWRISKKLGRVRCMALGTIPYGIFSMTIAAYLFGWRAPFVVYLASALIGIGGGLLWTASTQFVQAVASENTAATYHGWHHGVVQVSALIAAIFGGVLLNYLPSMAIFFCFSSFSFISIFVFFSIKEPEGRHQTEEHRSHEGDFPIKHWGQVLLAIPQFTAYFLSIQAASSLPLYVLEFGEITAVAMVGAAFKTGTICGSFGIGAIERLWGKIWSGHFCSLVGLLGVLMIVSAANTWQCSLGALLSGFYCQTLLPLSLSWAKERFPSHLQSALSAGAIIFANFGSLVGILVASFFSPLVSLASVGVLALLSALSLLFFEKLFWHPDRAIK